MRLDDGIEGGGANPSFPALADIPIDVVVERAQENNT